jgi:hypothetical protein
MKRNTYNFLYKNRKEGRSLGRSRHRWKDNIKMDLKRIEWVGVDWISDGLL